MVPNRRRFAPAWALGLGIAAAGCSEASTRPDPEGEVLRLGRVHIVLEPSEDRDAAEDVVEANEAQLDVTARFAFVRGLDEDFVRARVFMPVLAHEQVPVSECVVSDQLVADAVEPVSPELADMRELVLVDAGDLTVRIGDTDVDVPLALVPDLLPYISGVEYLQEAEMVPVAADATPSVTIQAGGSQTDDLPAFVAEGRVPAALGLTASESDLAEQLEGALVMRWREGHAEGPISIRVQALLGGEPLGEEITCVIADRGEARIDIARLHTLGLPAQGDALRLTASRVVVTGFDAGEFTGSELVVERRDRLYVPLR
ncbi:MAG TPA: hypothetical protein VFG69_02800 [Nannocystaceae bacterium]|nr:hypothetical protein [Nannocystaceae bacterium]